MSLDALALLCFSGAGAVLVVLGLVLDWRNNRGRAAHESAVRALYADERS